MTHHWHRYAGHTIVSPIALPELPTASAGPGDFRLTIVAEPLFPTGACEWQHDFTDPRGGITLSCARAGEVCYFRFPHVAEARADAQGDIAVWPAPGSSDESLRHVLLDQILPRLLAQRGRLILHGSAVRTATGRTFGMLGDSGHGKSTLAGALVLSGGQLLTDDCVLLRFDGEQVHAVPSYPGLRLWPDSLARLFVGRAHQATPMAHYCAKQRLPISESTDAAVVIDAVLVLQAPPEEPVIRLTPLPAQAACMALVRNSFQLDLSDRARLAQHLIQAATAAARMPVLALAYPRDYSRLPHVVEALEQMGAV
ncbi:hypothetical protein J2X06_003066 [Lysobacter niastensis]|uniref:Serine kinase n=1 Tax=Lysobacter niastensis TaxID=380629 RepID=A0ABU1WE17_9GAMM|nr:hypothetical protein [Lysobacter niastensis]MDR7135848.1 hypothetical protein [Lysobacter niastensis]